MYQPDYHQNRSTASKYNRASDVAVFVATDS